MKRGSVAPGGPTLNVMSRSVSLLLLAALLARPGGTAAQLPDFPTLMGAGAEYISPSGFFQLTFSGRLELDAVHVGDAWVGLIDREAGEDPLPADHQSCTECHVGMAFPGRGGQHGAHRLKLLADIFLGDHLYSLVELRSDRGSVPGDGPAEARLEQAFVRLTTTSGGAGVQLGRFASPFGGYPLRHGTELDSFLRPPIGYDYRTVMSRTIIPRDAPFLLRWREEPQFFRKPGVPPVWDVPYQWGAMLMGALGPVHLRVAAMNSAPSSEPEAWGFDADRFERPSWVAAVRARPSPSWDVGVSYDRGPWMEETIAGTILPPAGAPPGTESAGWRDFDQELFSVDVTFARGATVVSAEAMLDRWEVPNVADRAEERIYSGEIQRDLVAGLYVAARVGYIDFRPLADGLGAASPLPGGAVDWDHDVVRYEGSIGYRLARNVGVILSGLRQVQDEASDGDTEFAGLRLWWAF